MITLIWTILIQMVIILTRTITQCFEFGNLQPLNTYIHDEKCFTQGLLYHDNKLYESCGLYGKSSLRVMDAKSKNLLTKIKIDDKYFAEGITILNNKLYMLLWQQQFVLVFDLKTLKQVDMKYIETFKKEGWGLTTDGTHLIVSDGSDRIQFYEVKSDLKYLKKVKEIVVRDPSTQRSVDRINELQYVNDSIYANIWYKDVIIRINAKNGIIHDKYDLSSIYPRNKRSRTADCLNGIAYDPSDKTFLLTGKLWDKYYKVDLMSYSKTRENKNDF